jgi:hypothetical protein
MQSDGVKSPSIPFLVAVLRLSIRWLLSVGHDFAFETLPGHTDFTPFLQLQLAHEFRIREWVEPAFRSLVKQPLEIISASQATQMGDIPYYILSQTKCLIDNHLRCISFTAPPVQSAFPCDSPEMCEDAWNRAWWTGFAKHVLHPDCPLSGSEAMRVLDNVQIPGMCDDCLRSTVDSVWEAGPFEEIELIIRDGIGQVVEWATGEDVKNAYLEAQEMQMQMYMI